MRWLTILLLAAVTCVVAGELLACDQTPPIDQNFDSSLGEDFKPPPPPADAGPDAAAAALEATAP